MSHAIHFSQITPVFVASNFEKSVQYFRASLGFELKSQTKSGRHFAVMERDGMQFHLVEEEQGRNKAGLDALYSEITGYGGKLAEKLREFEPGKRMFLVADPDDNRIAFVEDSTNIFMDMTEISSIGE
jgi:predicted enzyme related to lactoylglutathione lyase